MVWTKERLEHVAQTRLGGAKLIVVANREPYIHRRKNGRVECIRPAGGLTTALDPVMQACGGTWVAHGSGDADKQTADKHGRLGVPPGTENYTLRRVWLTPEQEAGYYYGFANSSLWPLCHQVYCRPSFDPAHWETYREVNELFAKAVIEEAQGGPALVFVQDYHFALLPAMLKRDRPDIVVAHFWHIPWPNPETFSVCPWAKEILEGMLGNDLMSFHIQSHCNNFLDTVDRSIECKIDRERFAVQKNGLITNVRPHPISVDPELAIEYLGDDWESRGVQFRQQHQLGTRQLLVGVDRVDYTKGIPDRLMAVERLLETRPDTRGQFHFVQIGAPSRTDLPAYRELNDRVLSLVASINAKYGSAQWQPVVLLNEHHGPEDLFMLYRIAAGCVVSSLHDGMNLVAKEFVSARADEQGVLVLSEFTGAARELTDAVIVNPYDVAATADAMYLALSMPPEEQRRRMRRMRAQVADHNIYRWAGMLLSEVGKLADNCDDFQLESDSPNYTAESQTATSHTDPDTYLRNLIARETTLSSISALSGL